MAAAKVDAHEVVPGVWIGDVCAAHSWSWAAAHKITHILSIGERAGVEMKAQVLYFGTSDDADGSLAHHFEAIHDFIQSALGAGGHVLVHCGAGRSRSPAAVIAWLLLSRRAATYEEALAIVSAARETDINPRFARELKNLAASR